LCFLKNNLSGNVAAVAVEFHRQFLINRSMVKFKSVLVIKSVLKTNGRLGWFWGISSPEYNSR
jgi:hypothetical protein